MAADLGADMRQLAGELQLVSKAFAASLRREIRAACTEIGQDDLVKIRNKAAWSTGATATEHRPHISIPDATTLRPNFSVRSAGVRIVTNRRQAPHARPFEGVAGNGTFTNGKGGQVGTRPFFFAAIREMDAQTEARLLKAIDVICVEAGFRN